MALGELLAWLRAGGATFPKLGIVEVSPGERGGVALDDISPDELLVDIPRRFMLTREDAYQSDVVRRVLDAGVSVESDDSLFAAYLLSEVHRPDSFWQPFFRTLPPAFPGHPLFYGSEEFRWLERSAVLGDIQEQQRSVAADEQALLPYLPALKPGEFSWARAVLSSRSFGYTVDEARVDALVPLLEMLNHRRPHNVDWGFAPMAQRFRAAPNEPIPAGAELVLSYGFKSNRRYLLAYGFVTDDPVHDEAVIALSLPDDVPAAELKRLILLGHGAASMAKTFAVSTDQSQPAAMELFSFLRLTQASGEEWKRLLQTRALRPSTTGPLSVETEVRALRVLEEVCSIALSRFETTIAADNALLASSDLSPNARNCVLVRRGEKRALQHYRDYARQMRAVLEGASAEAFEGLKSQLIGGE